MAIRAEAIGDIFAGDGAVTSTSRSTARPSLLGSKVVLVVADAMAIVLAGLFVVAVRDQLDLASADASSEVWTVLAITPLWLVTLAQHRLYVPRYVTRPLEDVPRVVSPAPWTIVGASPAVSFACPAAAAPPGLPSPSVLARQPALPE